MARRTATKTAEALRDAAATIRALAVDAPEFAAALIAIGDLADAIAARVRQ